MAQATVLTRRQAAARPRVDEPVRSSRVVCYVGERIYFSTLEPEDAPVLERWINDPHIWANLSMRPPCNAPRERAWIEKLGSDPSEHVFGIVVRAEDRLIGSVGLHRIHPANRSAMLGISIGDAGYHNRGYGTEAVKLMLRYGFEELNLNRIGLAVYAHNLRAIRCYQKAGFVPEGCLRDSLYQGGRFHDEYRFAILRAEWDAAQKVDHPVRRAARRTVELGRAPQAAVACGSL
ncbi:MAG: GNAT family N-acetyltransferase [Phycisphaerae bacterium]|nr:GNAT family N-acetyltransferase [Phycisphaerae bacterium]